jgi:hypothetical protein
MHFEIIKLAKASVVIKIAVLATCCVSPSVSAQSSTVDSAVPIEQKKAHPIADSPPEIAFITSQLFTPTAGLFRLVLRYGFFTGSDRR